MVTKYIPTREEALAVVDGDEELLDAIYDLYFHNEVTADVIREKFKLPKSKLQKLYLRSAKAAYWDKKIINLYNSSTLSNKQIAESLGINFTQVEAAITRQGTAKDKAESQLETELETFSDEWRPLCIPGVKDYYKVGNKNGEIVNTSTNVLMSASLNKKDGYMYTMLSRDKPHTYESSGKVTHSIQIATHRLVALTYCNHKGQKAGTKEFFRYIKENKLTVNHGLAGKLDNSVSNLEWMTLYENNQHARENEFNNTTVVLTGALVHEICKLIQKGKTDEFISNKLDTDKALIYKIRKGYTWTKISVQYGIVPEEQVELRIEPLTDDEVRKVCKLILKGLENKPIAAKFNVDSRRIGDIRNMKRRTNISSEYFTEYVKPTKK